MAQIEWTGRAFLQLERMPSPIAYEVIQRVDFLEKFPEMGPKIRTKRKELLNCRQVIVGKHYRVIYEYEPDSETVFVLAIQHTRKRLPSMRDLRRN